MSPGGHGSDIAGRHANIRKASVRRVSGRGLWAEGKEASRGQTEEGHSASGAEAAGPGEGELGPRLEGEEGEQPAYRPARPRKDVVDIL